MIDCHAHLSDEILLPLLPDIVADMERDGLSAIVDTAYHRTSAERCYQNALRYPNIFAVVGTHPEEWATADESDFARYEEMYLSSEKVIAIGEIGLDYHYPELPKDKQIELFERQILLADRLNAPMVLHIRDAYGDAFEVLNRNKDRLSHGILLHCYSGSKEMVKQFDKFDCYYSFGGVLTFKNATEKPDVVRSIPKDRILLETDCPYMTPVPFRGTPCFPKYVRYSMEKMASILGWSVEETDTVTTENAKRLFPRLQ